MWLQMCNCDVCVSVHFSVTEVKSVVVQLEWSMDGKRLLTLSENSSIRVFRMKVCLLHVHVDVHVYLQE